MDIASLRVPKPRIITLEPIPRRPRNRPPSKATLSRDSHSSIQAEADARARQSLSDALSTQSSERACQSPVPSEISSTGADSSSNASFRVRSGPSLPPSNAGNDPRASGTLTQDKTITATVELLHGGCLPGDTLFVRISIDHTKPIVSTNGIIVTLYRKGRVDMHPALPLGPSEPGKKPQYEDYYPKSRTGLGGLSLSSAASTQGFRMDLDQSFTPLVVDPNTLTAVVKASVRVPDNVFPTISNTPGSMINFSYHVEVIIDLRGKLTIPDRILPRLGIKGSPSMHGYMDTMTWRSAGLPDPFHSQGTNFADTDQIKREKSVVACCFDVVMGTKNSIKKRSKRVEEIQGRPDIHAHTRDFEEQDENRAMHNERNQPDNSTLHGDYYDQNCVQGFCYEDRNDDVHQQGDLFQGLPLPESDEPQDEKSRIRRAEAQLLPSAPPLDDGDVASASNVPSAPPPSAFYSDYDSSPNTAFYGNLEVSHIEASPVYSRTGPSSAPPFPDLTQISMAIPYPPTSQGGSEHIEEDKQELERRRLLIEESAPPPENEAEQDEHGENEVEEPGIRPYPGISHISPSAPALGEEDDDCYRRDRSRTNPEAAGSSSSAAHIERPTGEALPRYEK